MSASWQILGLTPGSDEQRIKKRFRELALKYHPDKNKGKEQEAQAKFVRVEDVYRKLLQLVPEQSGRGETRAKHRAEREREWAPRKTEDAKKPPHPTEPSPENSSEEESWSDAPPSEPRPRYDYAGHVSTPWAKIACQLRPSVTPCLPTDTHTVHGVAAALRNLESRVKECFDAVSMFATWLTEELPEQLLAPSGSTRNVTIALHHSKNFTTQAKRVVRAWRADFDRARATLETCGAGTQAWSQSTSKVIWYKIQMDEMDGRCKVLLQWINDAFMDFSVAGKEFDYQQQVDFVRRAKMYAPILEIVD